MANFGDATLFVVATPIGNLADMSQRGVEVLRSVQRIFCEDTRQSAFLMSHFGISAPLESLHDHNESQKIDRILALLREGQSVALISDAGTPLISDPGYKVVQAVTQAKFAVVPVPGACALIAALSAAGLPTDRFRFEGFLPAKAQARKERLEALCHQSETILFYESKHRILESLQAMQVAFGAGREIVVARELTKAFETWYRGSIEEVLQQLQQDVHQTKGEFVVLVAGFQEAGDDEAQHREEDRVLTLLLAEVPVKTAAKLASALLQKPKNALYERALALKAKKDV